MGMERFFEFFENIGEKIFLIFGIVTLPIWFPVLALWVIFDPAYRIKIWQNRTAGHTVFFCKKRPR